MNEEARYYIAPNVIHEVIDGEVIIANLGDGSYYSLDGIGVDVWGGLADGYTVGQIKGDIARAFDVDHVQLANEIGRIVEEFASEALVEKSDNGRGADDSATRDLVVSTAYVAPTFQKFTDMQQLLLLDPIHDVDVEKGWPTGAEES